MAKLVVQSLQRPQNPSASTSCAAPVVAPQKGKRPTGRALSAIQFNPDASGEIDLSYASHEDLNDGTGHRPKEHSPTTCLGLVTKVIPARSAEFHSKRGKKAIDEEIIDLRAEEVWDESSVAEWSDVRHIKKDGMTPWSASSS